jgi:hypothetical protein
LIAGDFMNDYPKNSFELDTFLKRLIENPFLYLFEFPKEKPTISNYVSNIFDKEDISDILYLEEKKILQQFLRPIEIILRPHVSLSQDILNIFYKRKNIPTIQKILDQYGSDLLEKLENIRKFYRIFIEANTNNSLEMEANKLVKRFFGDNYSENHKNFIKMKRYIERLKSFYEQVSKLWKDVEKLLETFLYIEETKNIAEDIKNRLKEIALLNHQTDIFLKLLSKHLKIREFLYNPISFSYSANMTYEEDIDYTLEGIYSSYSQPIKSEQATIIEQKESISTKSSVETIVIESEIKRFYRNIIFTKIIGSKDWNRTKDYYLELNKDDYHNDLNKFFSSVHVIYDKKTYDESFQVYASKRTVLEKTQLEEIFQNYLNMLRDLFNQNYQEIVHKDFVGVIKPTIFFYHIGANTFYHIILEDLRDKKLGEILYLYNQVLVREYPLNIIKKILIDWWNDLSSLLDIEEIDSYWIYFNQLQIVLQEYLKDYEKIRNQTKNDYLLNYHFDELFNKNYKDYINIRKYYIYKRFYPSLLINFKISDLSK